MHGNIVERGAVRVRRRGTEIAVVRRGRGVGFLSILARDENGICAEAIEDSATFEFPAEALLQAYEEDFNFLRNAIRNLARGLLDDRGSLPTRDGIQPPIEEGVLRDRPRTLVERILLLKDAGIFDGKNLDAKYVFPAIKLAGDKVEEVFRDGDARVFKIHKPL